MLQRVLTPQQLDVGAHGLVGRMTLEKLAHMRARVGKEHLMDELDGRGRALDIQQDGAGVRQPRRADAPSGI